MQARVGRLYRTGDEGGSGGCPGEDKCETFQSSADDSPVRCPNCPKRSAAESDETEAADEETLSETWSERVILNRVERFARERDSGRRVYQLLQPLEWELLLIRDEAIDDVERSIRVATIEKLAILAAMH